MSMSSHEATLKIQKKNVRTKIINKYGGIFLMYCHIMFN